jgi:hypothetical protein
MRIREDAVGTSCVGLVGGITCEGFGPWPGRRSGGGREGGSRPPESVLVGLEGGRETEVCGLSCNTTNETQVGVARGEEVENGPL